MCCPLQKTFVRTWSLFTILQPNAKHLYHHIYLIRIRCYDTLCASRPMFMLTYHIKQSLNKSILEVTHFLFETLPLVELLPLLHGNKLSSPFTMSHNPSTHIKCISCTLSAQDDIGCKTHYVDDNTILYQGFFMGS